MTVSICEGDRSRLFFPRSDRDGLFPCSVQLVPSSELVCSGRYIANLEGAVLARHLEVGIRKHRQVSLHPRVHVTLYGNPDFRSFEYLVNRRGSCRLRFIPSTIDFGTSIDVMSGLIGVGDPKVLARHEGKDVRMIDTTVLVHRYHGFRDIK